MLTMEHWLPYAALAVFWLVLPSRAGFLVAAITQGKGRIAALFTLPAFMLAHAAAALAVSHLVLAAGLLSPSATAAIAWIGGALLAFTLLSKIMIPDLTGPFADNDNLRLGPLPRAFFDTFAETFFEKRTLIFYLAVVPHFLTLRAAWQPQLAELIAATILAAVISGIYPAFFANRFMTRIRLRSALRRKPARGSMVSTASGAVVAGYRKIAA